MGVFGFSAATSARAEPREHVLPERNDDRAARQSTWTTAGAWLRSPAVRGSGGGDGYRVSAMMSVHDGRSVALQARGVGSDSSGVCAPGRDAGEWVDMEETFTGAELRVAVVDLDGSFPCAEIRMAASDDAAVGDLQWELLEPQYPSAGAASRELAAGSTVQHALSPALEVLDVISRDEWGARATQCSTPEDDWYRMAIHHTAGPQTANGTVVERLQGTQAYAMDSGGYCDLPYQMMVGFDGSLYEGRSLDLMSGATGGGNNPGNLAVCFIGCYHTPDSDCVGGEGHEPTEEMMLRGQLLVQTLAVLEEIPTTEDSIRGHRDWPGNSTACPGSLLHPRLGELREGLAWFAGTEIERSWDEQEVEVEMGVPSEVWIELENTGGLAWLPGQTFLAPTEPRDGESPLYDDAWPSTTRAATVDAEAEPGETGRFVLSITVNEEGPVTQTFGLVHEEITWFADPPWGGGPTDDAVAITVRGIEVEADTGDDGTAGSDSGEDDGTDPPAGTTTDGDEGETGEDSSNPALPPATAENESGCGCRSGSGSAPWALALLVLLATRRSRTVPRGR